MKGSTTEVNSDGKVIPEAEVAGRVITDKVRVSLASASDLIAVGLASQEGERSQEEARALARAETVAGWMTKAGNPGIALWTLTLGQYDKGCKQQEDADFELRAAGYIRGRAVEGRDARTCRRLWPTLSAVTIICRAESATPASTWRRSGEPRARRADGGSRAMLIDRILQEPPIMAALFTAVP